MFKLIVILFFLLLLFSRNKKIKNGFRNPSSLLIGEYLIASVLSIPHVLINLGSYHLIFQDKYWIATIVFVATILLFLLPFLLFRENSIEEIFVPNMQVLNLFSTIIIILSLFSIAFFLPSVIRLFQSGVALNSLRNSLGSVRDTYVNTGGLANTIASVSASLYPFAMMLFFIYFSGGQHPVRCLLLFVSSTSNIINVLSYVGRDGVVFWIIMFASMYFFFNDYLVDMQKKKIKKIFVISAIVGLIPFIVISLSRFGSSTNKYATLKSILSYMGQMVPNYLLYYDVRGAHYNLGGSFPLFWEVIGMSPPKSVRWIDGGTESNVFGTFIKSLNISLGVWGTVLLAMISGFFFIYLFRNKKRRMRFHHFFLYFLYYKIVSEGVFYFRDYTRGGNLFIVISLVFFFVFYFVERSFGITRLEKKI